MYRKANSAQERAEHLRQVDEALSVLETLCSPAPFFCGSEPSSPDCALFPTFVFCEFMLEEQFGWADAFYDKASSPAHPTLSLLSLIVLTLSLSLSQTCASGTII